MATRVLAVKYDETGANLFDDWCKSHGMSVNEVLHYMVDVVLQMQNQNALPNARLAEAVQTWEGFRNLDTVGSVMAELNDTEVVECIYLLHEKCKKGLVALLVEQPLMNQPIYSTDKNEILDELMSAVCKTLRYRLSKIGERLDTHTIIETVTALCDYYEQENDEDREFIRELFSDNNRHDYGRSNDDIIQYKKHNRKNIREAEQLTLTLSEKSNENDPPGHDLGETAG